MSGWDYGPGNFADPGVNYSWESALSGSSYGGSSLPSSWENWAQYIGKVGVDTWAQTNLMQQAQNGQMYLEGQRLNNAMMQQRVATGGIPPVFLLLAVGAFFMLRK